MADRNSFQIRYGKKGAERRVVTVNPDSGETKDKKTINWRVDVGNRTLRFTTKESAVKYFRAKAARNGSATIV